MWQQWVILNAERVHANSSCSWVAELRQYRQKHISLLRGEQTPISRENFTIKIRDDSLLAECEKVEAQCFVRCEIISLWADGCLATHTTQSVNWYSEFYFVLFPPNICALFENFLICCHKFFYRCLTRHF